MFGNRTSTTPATSPEPNCCHSPPSASAAQIIPNKDQAVLVYCHSGRRSRKACLLLSKLGYTHICDLGGILDWPYEKE